MSPPICHRSITHGGGTHTLGGQCLGSTCALWVPASKGNEQYKLGVPLVGLDQDGDPVPLATPRPNDSGWCADNLRREPWPDPAAPKAGGAS